MPSLDFDIIPSININLIVVRLAIRMVTNTDSQSTLNFYIKENVGNQEPNKFWIEIKHDMTFYWFLEEIWINNIFPQIWNKFYPTNQLFYLSNNFLLSQTSDFVNSDQEPSHYIHTTYSNQKQPNFVYLQPGIRMIYLNNSWSSSGMCNSTIGVVTKVNLLEQYIWVAVSIRGLIVDVDVYKYTHYFNVNENNTPNSHCKIVSS